MAWQTLAALVIVVGTSSALHGKQPPASGRVSHSQLVFSFSDPELLPEDIVYDNRKHRFYVSSVRRRTIVSCDSHGKCDPLLKAKGEALFSMLGLWLTDNADPTVWALTSSLEAEQNHDRKNEGRSALLSIWPYNGMLYTRIEPEGAGHALGDMTGAKDGTLYVSDGKSGDLYFLRPGSDRLETLVPAGTFRSPQTPALSADGETLYVPDYSKGIAAIQLKTRAVTWLESAEELRGIDGLYFYKDGLIAVQNGSSVKRILRLRLKKGLAVGDVDVLEANTPELGEPTHGFIHNGWFYFLANTGWDRVAEDGGMRPGSPAQVRRLRLP
jgi:sugar lactone lactonase YvrE